MKIENKDYKKLYEEALERAKVVNKGTEDYNIITAIFPELKESEDEKIRKEIISLIKETHVTDRYYDLNKMLAWLEKQGEQKSVFSKGDDKVFKDIYEDLHAYYTLKANMLVYDTYKKEYEKKWEDAKKWLEKHVAP